jgi:hypothetical protein
VKTPAVGTGATFCATQKKSIPLVSAQRRRRLAALGTSFFLRSASDAGLYIWLVVDGRANIHLPVIVALTL